MELKSQVEYFGRALLEKGAHTPNLVVLDADVSESTKTNYFKESYPDRFIQVGISEQDLIGISAGLAISGKIAVPAGFANFVIGRGWEQIANTVARQNLNVKIVGTHSGLSPHADGESHQTIGDIAITRVLPNMTVVVPADAATTSFAIKELIDRDGPAYLRLVRGSTPVVYPDDHDFEIGKAETLKDGSDVALIATGTMVAAALEAANELSKESIDARVIDMHTIKPLDVEAIHRSCKETLGIVTAEEHSIIGGLGGAVAEIVTETKPIPMKRIGIRDMFGMSSRSYPIILEKFGLTSTSIIEAASSIVKER